jgi:hypothetical protein
MQRITLYITISEGRSFSKSTSCTLANSYCETLGFLGVSATYLQLHSSERRVGRVYRSRHDL